MPHVSKTKLPQLNLGSESIGERIARLRKERALTQQELADKIGINRVLVTDYERGKIRLYDEMVARFAIALGVSADDILGLKEYPYEKYIPSLRIMKRLRQIEKLSQTDQKALLRNIDMFLQAAHKSSE